MKLDLKIITGFIDKQTDWYEKQYARGYNLHLQANIALNKPNVTFKAIDNLTAALKRISESFKKLGKAFAGIK